MLIPDAELLRQVLVSPTLVAQALNVSSPQRDDQCVAAPTVLQGIPPVHLAATGSNVSSMTIAEIHMLASTSVAVIRALARAASMPIAEWKNTIPFAHAIQA